MEGKYYYRKSGSQFRITPKENLDLHEKLPAGTYSVGFDECTSQYFLETINDFELKGKIYGDVAKNSDRIMHSFLERPRSTGVLLVGDKGSGKTLLAQYISIAAARDKDIPTIVINKPWHGDAFNLFMQSISQPTIILFDEFEKVYKRDGCENEQEKILTLFDGVYSSQKLFLLTCNNKQLMDEHMMNRPGRIYYMLEFYGLNTIFIEEYCEDNLLQKNYIPAVSAISALFKSFNFDMLKAMVEDMNRYNESPSEVLKFLNIRPDNGGQEHFIVKLIVNGAKDKNAPNHWSGNPLSEVIGIYCAPEDGDSKYHYFSASHLKKLDSKTRVYKFKNESGDVLVLTPVPSLKFSLNYDTLASSSMQHGPENDNCDSDSDHEEKKYEAMMYGY